MLPTINGKEIIDCSLEDIQVIIDNPDYAENEYLDYKKAFPIDTVDKDKRQQEQVEFRNDVCAFANANGGYLIFGVDEKKGIPTEISGISIKYNNKDLFERDVRNYLQSIKPKIPYYKIRFVNMPDEKYIVIILVQHDYFAPYIHLADQKNYKMYKRAGNEKIVMDYQEIKAMFVQSLSLEKEIEQRRAERINFFISQEDDQEHTYSKFFMMHIFPESFLDFNYSKPMFVLERKGAKFSPIFNAFECNTRSVPTPEGLRFLGREVKAECKLYNNGIAEIYYTLAHKLHIGMRGENDKGKLPYVWLWQNIDASIRLYVDVVGQYIRLQRFFVCFSFVGCKDVLVESNFEYDWESKIDRNILLCYPGVFEIINDRKLNEDDMSRLHLEFLTSLGVKADQTVQLIIDKLYGET